MHGITEGGRAAASTEYQPQDSTAVPRRRFGHEADKTAISRHHTNRGADRTSIEDSMLILLRRSGHEANRMDIQDDRAVSRRSSGHEANRTVIPRRSVGLCHQAAYGTVIPLHRSGHEANGTATHPMAMRA